MVDPFFKKKSNGTKPRPNGSIQKRKRTQTLKKNLKLDQALAQRISSDEESEAENLNLSESEDDEVEETAEEKRLRLAKLYLDGLKVPTAEDALEVDAKELDNEIIASRLHRDVLETEGILNLLVADQLSAKDNIEYKFKKCHQSPVTAIASDSENKFIYTGSLDSSIIQWDFDTLTKKKQISGGRRGVKNFQGHTDHILSLAVSSDGKYLASGSKDKLIIIWTLPELEFKGVLKQHKDSVTGLCFRQNSLDLYSSSLDRMIKVWNIESMGYVETLYGHQDGILSLSTLAKEQCISVGGRDRTLRCWQIVNSGQLIFRAGTQSKYTLPKNFDLSQTLEPVVENLSHCEDAANDAGKLIKYIEGSLDCCSHIDEDHFISGGDSGSVSIWSLTRKKPIFTFPVAHGINPENLQPYPILSLAICPYTDVVVTGSYNGQVKFWKINTQAKYKMELLYDYELPGFVNGGKIQMVNSSPKADFEGLPPTFHVLLAVGQHFAQGRWERTKFGRNGFVKISIPLKEKPKSFE